MAPAATNLLFHPKKKNGHTKPAPSPSPTKPNRAPPPPRVKPKADNDDDTHPLPDGPFQEFRLVSSAASPWKYDIMRFDSRRPVDVTQWQQPVKLNRKDVRKKDDGTAPAAPVAVGYMLGPDGKPVVGADGRQVQVDAEGRPIHLSAGQPRPKIDPKGKGGAAARKFQKKTRQVFLIPEETRQLRREERYPWVLEDTGGEETWKGSMEEVVKSETHAIFLPSMNARDQFNLIPIHRWYKFQKKPTWNIFNSEEADAHMSKKTKNSGGDRWLMKGLSTQSQATFKAAAEGRQVAGENSLVHEAGSSRATGGRQLRAVNSGMEDLFGADDDEEDAAAKRRREREMGHEGDLDELDFEETFADDEEKMEADDQEDEEAKELEERLKKEYKQANKTREGHIDESDDEEPDQQLGKSGNAIRKLIGRLEKNDQYESDDEKNPYASSEEEEEEDVPLVQDGPAIQQQDQQKNQPTPDAKTPGLTTTPKNGQPSRASSPSAPSLGGHSILAKRATSPKLVKTKAASGSRATSPLANASSRATSPAGSRAGSPPVGTLSKPGGNKRKAEDGGPVPATPTSLTKKKRTGSTSGEAQAELDAQTIIAWLRPGNRTTKDFSAKFKTYFQADEGRRARLMALVKEVATMKDGVLSLRKQHRTPSAAPSPGQP